MTLEKRPVCSLILRNLRHIFYLIDVLRTEKVKVSYFYDILVTLKLMELFKKLASQIIAIGL